MNPKTQNSTTNLIIALNKISLALRSEAWKQSNSNGLNPTQAQILSLLQKSEPQRLSDITQALGISAASASESIRTLVSKQLVNKQPAPDNARAIALSLTEQGQEQAKQSSVYPDFLIPAVEELNIDEQAILLRSLSKLIRTLLLNGQISVARMCYTCTYFQVNAHPENPRQQHHCQFLDTPFGDLELRLDCAEHQLA